MCKGLDLNQKFLRDLLQVNGWFLHRFLYTYKHIQSYIKVSWVKGIVSIIV